MSTKKICFRNRLGTGLVVLGALTVGIGYGYACSQRQLPGYVTLRKIHNWSKEQTAFQKMYGLLKRSGVMKPQQAGSPWKPIRRKDKGDRLTDSERELIGKMEAIGYLSGYKTMASQDKVTTHEADAAFPGYNLYTSGHDEIAIMVDMEGEVVHTWAYDIGEALEESNLEGGGGREEWWNRTYLFENGDLLVINTDRGLLKLDKDSNLIWVLPGNFHHDVTVTDEGIIYALTREVGLIPRVHEYEPTLADFVTVLTPDGDVVRNVSILEAFENSSYASFLKLMPRFGDLLHTNYAHVFDGSREERSKLFKKGNVLVSVLTINAIAIIDMEKKKVIWGLSGQWAGQHHPLLLDNGNMLILDNRGHNGVSKVIEFDPFTQEIVWAFEGDDENGFYTLSYGGVQRLPNGNTLINESNGGRAFEVTPDKRVVWEYYNPARAGEKDDLIATLYDFKRIPPEYVSSWLSASSPE